jgi:putative sterol carrier protein
MSQKNDLQALNSHMILALYSIFLTGSILVIIGIVFAINIATAATLNGLDAVFLKQITLLLLISGIVLIFIGTLQAIGLMGRIKKFLDKIDPNKLMMPAVVQTMPSEGMVMAPSVAPSQGLGGGLKIIRGEMGKTAEESSAPAPASKAPSSPKPTPIPVATGTSAPAVPPKPAAAPAKAADAPLNMTFEEALQNIIDRYNTEKVKKSFKNWQNNLMMSFKDLGKSYVFQIHGDEGIELNEGRDENAAVQVNLDSTIFIKMLTKQINPIKAYSSGGLEVKGEMKNMLKLRQLMF